MIANNLLLRAIDVLSILDGLSLGHYHMFLICVNPKLLGTVLVIHIIC